MISGYLRLIMETGSKGCTGTYAFEADSGAYFEPVQNLAKAPIERHIYAEFEGNRLVRWDFHPIANLINQMNKDIALTRVIGPSGNYENAKQLVERGADELEYWLRLCNREAHWEHIRVTPYVLVNHDSMPLGLQFQWHQFREQMEEQYPDRYDEHIYWHGWGGHRAGVLGHAHRNGRRAWTYGGQQRTIRHEQGHNFGQDHSWWATDQYGHPICIMANAHSGFCGGAAYHLGLVPEDYTAQAQSHKTYFLLPLECDPKDARNGEVQLLRVGDHILSTRKTRDQLETGSRYETGLLYVDKPLNHSWVSPQYVTRMADDESRDIAGFHVSNAGHHKGVVKVEIDGGEAGATYPQPLPPLDSDVALKRDTLSGIWHNPAEKKQGIDISVRGDQVIGYWYTYHALGSTGAGAAKTTGREWFELDGRIEDEHIVVDVYQYKGRERKKVGHGTMTLLEGNLRFRFWCENYGRDHLDLTRYTSPKLSQSIYETGEHEGYSVAQYEVPETPENPEGLLWVAYHFAHTGIDDLTWQMLDGVTLTEMRPHEFSGRYKMTYEPHHNEGLPANLQAILDDATPILEDT